MIQAKIVADSLSPQGHRLTTLEVVMPRYILAEFNTHRILSKNSASSRAIPFNKMVKNVQENPFIPYAWQIDHKGMQGSNYFTDEEQISEHRLQWLEARNIAIQVAENMNHVGNVTKQLCNRLLEPFMYHKVLVSGTEWENFFNLRCPQYEYIAEGETYTTKSWKSLEDMLVKRKRDSLLENAYEVNQTNTLFRLKHNKGQADIHMMFLAEAIYDAIQESTPRKLKEGEWHIPYGDNFDMGKIASISTKLDISITEIVCKISVARCARLSYQTLGDNPEINYEKDLELYEVLSKSGHWSPFEHVARVMTEYEYNSYLHGRPLNGGIYSERGWCRNFKGFIQQRALID
jgi:thymidylate synthase ThyX